MYKVWESNLRVEHYPDAKRFGKASVRYREEWANFDREERASQNSWEWFDTKEQVAAYVRKELAKRLRYATQEWVGYARQLIGFRELHGVDTLNELTQHQRDFINAAVRAEADREREQEAS